MTLRLNGSTSGYVELDAPAVAGTTALTLPATSGTVATEAYADTAGGLVHVNTTAFTSSAAVNFNNVFTSTYDKYRVLISLILTGGDEVRLRLRASGSDITAANYFLAAPGIANNGAAVDYSQTGGTFLFLGYGSSDIRVLATLDFYAPQLAERKVITGNLVGLNSTSNLYVGNAVGGAYNVATAADGFSVYPSQNTITGRISVYGYKNS